MTRFILAVTFALGLLGLAGGHAHAACNVPNPNLLAGDGVHAFVDNCALPAQALNRLITPVQIAPLGIQVPTNTALKALVGTAGEPVYRAGFAAAGDGGAAKYVFSASSCTLNSGAGDNGSQVAPTAGGCFNADFGGNNASVMVWGAKCDGSTDDGPAFNLATASYERLVIPPAVTCRIATPVVFTLFPMSLAGAQTWPSTSGVATTIKCDTGSSDCMTTLSTTTQKGGLQLEGLSFDAHLMSGGNALRLYDTTSSAFTNLTFYNVWNAIRVDGPNDNLNSFKHLIVDTCRGEQAVLWTNGSMVNNSNVLTIEDGVIACNSATNGIVMDGNLQTLRLARYGIIDSGKQFFMRNTVGSTVCPGYVFMNDVEFNGGTHTVSFVDATCGYSVQMSNIWSFGATSGDGYTFKLHTAPSTVGSNVLLITNSFLAGSNMGGKGMFLSWNNVSISNTEIAGSVGDVLQVGANALDTVITGGSIAASTSGYCVSSTSDATTRTLLLTGTQVNGGCSLGNFHDLAEAVLLTGSFGNPAPSAFGTITGCGTGCTVVASAGNQSNGTILMTTGTTATASGHFLMNFPLHLTPAPLCFVTPRAGGAGVWNPLATVIIQPISTAQTEIFWNNNSVALTDSVGYFLDFRCSAML